MSLKTFQHCCFQSYLCIRHIFYFFFCVCVFSNQVRNIAWQCWVSLLFTARKAPHKYWPIVLQCSILHFQIGFYTVFTVGNLKTLNNFTASFSNIQLLMEMKLKMIEARVQSVTSEKHHSVSMNTDCSYQGEQVAVVQLWIWLLNLLIRGKKKCDQQDWHGLIYSPSWDSILWTHPQLITVSMVDFYVCH